MAVKSRNSFWHGLHLLTRLIGLTGVMAALVGWFIYSVLEDQHVGRIVLLSSAGAVALALLFEVRGVLRTAFSHRGLFGFNVLLQIALALAIVGGANVFSFLNFKRFDLTRDQIFTLDDETRKQLEQLEGETEIIVVQNNVSFGQRAGAKQDKYDVAAQKKIVEKVKDLAEAFQDLGPRFRVRVLDLQDESDDRLDEIRAEFSDELADAIEDAPVNSVFVYSAAKKRIQRISFSDIYLLDKQSSAKNKNLVLHYQGIGPFARKVFNVEEKSPRVAAAVIHPLLGLHDKRRPEFTMVGAREILDAYGFESTDIALRRLSDDGGLGEPTVLTYDESQYEEIEDELADLKQDIQRSQKEYDDLTKVYKLWSESTLAELNKKYAYFILPDGRQGVTLRTQVDKIRMAVGNQARIIDVDEDDRKNMTTRSKSGAELVKHFLDADRDTRDQLLEKQKTLRVDNLAEKRRFADLEAKAKMMLADVDLLIVPRLTLIDIPQQDGIPNRLHKLETAQLNAIRSYIKRGKPVLFLLGPSNEPPRGEMAGPAAAAPDSLETMLGEFGFYLPKQTILYDAEKREFNERKFGGFGSSKREVDLPPLRYDEKTSIYTWGKKKEAVKANHPIRSSVRVMNRALVKTDPDTEAEMRKMAGTWKITAMEVDGKKSDEKLGPLSVVVQNDRIVFKDQGKTKAALRFAIDPFTAPKAIDFRYVSGPKKGARELGIYEWDGEHLVLYLADPLHERPTDMKPEGVAGRKLTLKRVAAAPARKGGPPRTESVLRVRHPRPVYFMRASLSAESAASLSASLTLPGLLGPAQAASIWVNSARQKPDDSVVILLTREEAWNEDNPFIVEGKVPRYTPTEDADPKKGTPDAERRGPFPIGVAVETQVPASWYDKDAGKAPKVRLAVIGSGGLFVGPGLPPVKEKLLLDTVNWLLGRDDLLARDVETWQYPRVELTPLEQKCWFVVCYGLPFAFVYLGTVVWLMRRMR